MEHEIRSQFMLTHENRGWGSSIQYGLVRKPRSFAWSAITRASRGIRWRSFADNIPALCCLAERRLLIEQCYDGCQSRGHVPRALTKQELVGRRRVSGTSVPIGQPVCTAFSIASRADTGCDYLVAVTGNTYSELNHRSNCVADQLCQVGVSRRTD
jgi:hypothetical protein